LNLKYFVSIRVIRGKMVFSFLLLGDGTGSVIDKLGLDERESAFLTAQIIGCGDLGLIEIDKNRAFELLDDFFERFAPDDVKPDDFVSFIYRTVQNSLLAFRAFSFETLQQLPPFSEFGKKNLIQLLKFRQERGVEAFHNGFRRMFRDGWETRRPESEVIRVLGGDGKTIDTPVKFSTAEMVRRIAAEYWFIIYHYGKEREAWERGVHFSVSQPKTDRLISSWQITLADGENVRIYFDTDKYSKSQD
jgi:hypothetical protein